MHLPTIFDQTPMTAGIATEISTPSLVSSITELTSDQDAMALNNNASRDLESPVLNTDLASDPLIAIAEAMNLPPFRDVLSPKRTYAQLSQRTTTRSTPTAGIDMEYSLMDGLTTGMDSHNQTEYLFDLFDFDAASAATMHHQRPAKRSKM
jgi:hypothetical protein